MNENHAAYSERVIVPSQPSKAEVNFAQENIGMIDSLLHPSAILIRQVLTRSGRLECNMILIDDEENIFQALKAGVSIHSLYFSGEAPSQQLTQNLFRGRVYQVARRMCKKLFENDKVSRVFAIAHTPTTLSLNSLQDISRDIVALEDLTISGNIGAIARTAAAFGIAAIALLSESPVDIYDRRLIRASRGYIFSLPVVTATTGEFIRFCKEKGISLLIMDAQAARPMQEVTTASNRFAIAFGSEKEGCSQTLRAAAMLQVQIPTSPRVESLNVSTAAAIALYSRSWFNSSQIRE
jgi:TrmH family RNA methyltransferase